MSKAGRRPRPRPGRVTTAAGADMLHAEWTKLRTLASTCWLLAAAVAVTIAVSAAAVVTAACPPGTCAAGQSAADPAKLSLTGVEAGQAFVAIIAVLAICGEYGTGMIRVTLTAMPRRLCVLAAKAALVGAVVLAAGTAAVLASVLVGRLALPGRGFTPANGYPLLSLAAGPDLRAAAGSVLYLTLVALLALGIATAVRDSAVAIGIVLALLYLFPVVTAVVASHSWQRHLEQASPLTAGLYIQVTVGVHALPLAPWQGLGVTALWAAGALLLGGALLRLRDA